MKMEMIELGLTKLCPFNKDHKFILIQMYKRIIKEYERSNSQFFHFWGNMYKDYYRFIDGELFIQSPLRECCYNANNCFHYLYGQQNVYFICPFVELESAYVWYKNNLITTNEISY